MSLFGIDSIGSEFLARRNKDVFSVFKELKFSSNEGYLEDGNTKFLDQFKQHLYLTEHITENMLQEFDDNIVKHTREISKNREDVIVWKYFQYLSLLFTEIYLDKYFNNKTQLLFDLNQFVIQFNTKNQEQGNRRNVRGERVFQAIPFKDTDLNKLAFWNATSSGKTFLMHINIKQYLHYAQKYNKKHENKILLITPNESLSYQHKREFDQSSIPSNLFVKNKSVFSGKEVEIIEISKLSDESKDKTVAVDSFETNNLVLIDEGHGGMSGEQWKVYRDQLSKTGFAFEYSATFGQAINAATSAKKEALTQEYSKSILFDYSYKYFYEDGYGKDYRILNLREDNADYKNKYLMANLLSFYQQMLLYRNKPDLVSQFRLYKPLWVFVGSSVNALRKENGIETSDVLDIVYFINDFLKKNDEFISYIKLLLQDESGLIDNKGYSIFRGSFDFILELEMTAEDVYRGINADIFHNQTIGANLYLDDLKGANGELGLRVGNSDKYFGVINVGDEKKLHQLAMNNKILGTVKDFSDSLFAHINLKNPKHEINVLIGSKKFTEGWSSMRVCSMGLMNIGKSEGAQIIQLFGRGVRLEGKDLCLKRSNKLDEFQKPENIKEARKYIRPLETLQIFGVKANYMEKFKEFLEQEGLPVNDGDWISYSIPTYKKSNIQEHDLKIIQVKENKNFKKETIFKLELNHDIFIHKLVELDWYPKIETLGYTNSTNLQSQKNKVYIQSAQLKMINWSKLYFEIQNHKSQKGYSNIQIELEELKNIISSNSWYYLYAPKDQMEFSTLKSIHVWQDMVEALLKKYIDQYYIFFKNKYYADHIETVSLKETDDNFIVHYDIRINKNEEIDRIERKIEDLKVKVIEQSFVSLQIADQIEAFDASLHLYKPLIYLGKGYENQIQIFPVALDESESIFIKDLQSNISSLKTIYKISEIYLLRNQSKKGIGLFADGNNFYPDFILWIKKGDLQYISFVDPKGIRNSKGITDPKIQFFNYLKNKLQNQVAKDNIVLNSFIISNSKWLEVHWKENLSIKDFNDNNVFFQADQKEVYIEILFKKILSF